MIQKKNTLILALLFPIIALFALTAYYKFVLYSGDEIVLPIRGYDPRDLLSGHYLIYQIDYGVDGICPDSTQQVGYVCLAPKGFSYSPPGGCSKLIRGFCQYSRFEAGIEKYFVPENQAKHLEDQIRSKKASIALSLTGTGHAQVKDLLLDGKSWKSLADDPSN